LQALYLAGDMDFLLSFPVPIRAVFVAKLLQAVLPNLGLVSLFGLPILFGLGTSGGYHFLYYPLVILVICALTLAGSALSSLLVMMVARVFPARRAAEIIGFLGATLGLTCSQWYNFSHAFGENDFSDVQVSGLSDLLTRADTLWLPLNWAGRGLVDIGEGRWLTGIPLLLLTFGLCAAAFGFSLVTAERWYYSGWAGMQVVTNKKKSPRVSSPRAADAETNLPAWTTRLLKPPVRAILSKDILVLRRDLRNLSQLISPLILGVLYTVAIFNSGGDPPPGQGDAPDWFMDSFRVVLSYGNVGMALFVGWMLLTRLAGVGVSMEGKNYWLLKVSPLRVEDFLLAKFLMAYLPSIALGAAFLVAISIFQKISPVVFAYSLIAMLFSMAGLTGLTLGFSAAGANLNWDDPRKMNAGVLGCFGQIVAFGFLPFVFLLFIAPIGLAPFFQLPEIVGYLAGLFIGGGFSLAFAVIPPWMARKKVERLGES
jgi:ABC-2 type transport system permease protein